jgi:hypothetical protein
MNLPGKRLLLGSAVAVAALGAGGHRVRRNQRAGTRHRIRHHRGRCHDPVSRQRIELRPTGERLELRTTGQWQ